MNANAFFSLSGPLDALPAPGQMRAANFRGFHGIIGQLGGDPLRILARFGIDPVMIGDSDHLIDCRALGSVFEYCSTRFDRSLFGLELAEVQGPDVFGLVTAICRAAPTLGEAIDCFVKYLPVVHSPVSDLEFVQGAEICELRFGGNSMVRDVDSSQIMYEASLLIVKLLREVGGPAFRPSYVSLDNAVRQSDVPEIERRFGCPWRKGSGFNAIGFPARLLNLPVASSSRQLFQLLQGYLERLHQSSRLSMIERLEDCVRSSFQTGNCSAEWCANKLGMTARTLRMRLAQMNLKFSDVVERQRIDLAVDYLDRPDVSLDDVAFRLGYSEQSSFGRAFKRWTGRTPQSHRASRSSAPG